MARVQRCEKCSHGKSDHIPEQRKNVKIRGKCEWKDCTCERFVGDSGSVLRITPYKKVLSMHNLGSDGKPR